MKKENREGLQRAIGIIDGLTAITDDCVKERLEIALVLLEMIVFEEDERKEKVPCVTEASEAKWQEIVSEEREEEDWERKDRNRRFVSALILAVWGALLSVWGVCGAIFDGEHRVTWIAMGAVAAVLAGFRLSRAVKIKRWKL